MEERPEISRAAFDRYVQEHGIPPEHHPAAFALWLAEVTGGPVPAFQRVERQPPADGVETRATTLCPPLVSGLPRA